MSLQLHIGNSTHELDHLIDTINAAFAQAKKKSHCIFGDITADIFVINDSYAVIPELGISGYTPTANTIYLYVDKNKKIIDVNLFTSIMIHELHHAARWNSVGYGSSLGEALVSEGLACLLESEYNGIKPIYTELIVPENIIKKAIDDIRRKDYDHNKWFFGTGDIERWSGYSLGYFICKNYSDKNHKTSAELVNTEASEILKDFLSDKPG